MQTIRPFGRNRIALHLPADHPALDRLKRLALSVATYSQAGKVVAFDLCFEAHRSAELRRLLAQDGDATGVSDQTVINSVTKNLETHPQAETYQQIADATGVERSTVSKSVREFSQTHPQAETGQPEKVKGKDGKEANLP